MKHLYLFLALLVTTSSTLGDSALETPDNENDQDPGREKRETFDLMGYLSEFGYLQSNFGRLHSHGSNGEKIFHSDDEITSAIRNFQKFNGLKVTGVPDDETLDKMKSPRCGIPDIISTEFEGGHRPMAFTALGSRWNKDTVTWTATDFSDKLRRSDQWRAFQRAFDLWEREIPIKFRRSDSEPDIEIKFARGDHGDGWRNRFLGKGGTLAHAYGPGYGIGGDTHFDADEDWSMDTGVGTDLTTVAAHEFGHAIGLGHSSVPGALMAPYYRYQESVELHEDDIQGIQSIYGSNSRTTPKPTTTTTTPTTTPTKTTTTTPTTTTTTTTTTTRRTTFSTSKPPTADFCSTNFRLDAISQGPDGKLYAFRENLIYKIGRNGLEEGYPKYIKQVFPQAPGRNVRAVAYVPETRKMYMFKDSRVWRFSGFDLDEGYPKTWTTAHYYRPSAALTLTYNGVSQVFMFGHNYFWEWNHYTETMVAGYPLALHTYFPHTPMLPDAAFMNRKGHFIFFKYNTYKIMKNRGSDSESLALGPNLFGAVCGGQTPNMMDAIPVDFEKRPDVLYNDILGLELEPEQEMEFSPSIWTLVKGKQNSGGDSDVDDADDSEEDGWWNKDNMRWLDSVWKNLLKRRSKLFRGPRHQRREKFGRVRNSRLGEILLP